MALNPKRKRPESVASRKIRKVEEDIRLNLPDGEREEDTDEASAPGESEGAEGGEEEEWTGIGTIPPLSQGSVEGSGGKPNKPPMGEELRVIKDAADLFRSSSFKLQIDALLPNVRPKASRIPPLDRFLLAFHTFLMEIPSISQQHPIEAARKMLKKGIAIPYTLPLPTEETNWKVGYERPSDIVLVGSWANKISVKPKDGLRYGVDLAVEMPNNLLQEKDYLNGRFFQKRAFYLAAIAAAIKTSKNMNVDLFYESPSGDPRLTNLVLIPRKDDSATDFTKLNTKIVIIPTVSNTCPIPITRLSPKHSNLRLSSSKDTPETRQIPSPSYNTTILHAFTPRAHLLNTHELKQESPAFSDAVTLLRVWANQRGFSEGSSEPGRMCVRGFGGKGPWWVAVLSLIVLGEDQGVGKSLGATKRKALGRGLSSYQMFKAALDFLAKFESEKDAVFVKSASAHRFPPDEYDTRQGPVFVDSTSLVNLLSGVPRGSLELLRYEAAKTLETLNQTAISGDSFAEVFLREHRNLPTKFDSILRVNLSNTKPRNPSLEDTIDKGSPFNSLLLSIDTLLHHGLGNRTKAVTIVHPSALPRPIGQALPPNPDVIHIGLLYHPQHATRLVDYGPAADEQDQNVIDAFKDFWGDKAELRRFKDGRILESVVWDVKTADERAHIPGMVVRYILKRHFGISEDAVHSWQSGFDTVLRLPESVSSLYINGGLPVGFKSALTAFDDIVKAIKNLDDELPLATLNVSPISEALRYTSVFSPVPVPNSLTGLLPPNGRYLLYIEIVVEFEKSSKWPDDLKAIQKIKLAFFERVASALMKSVQSLRAKVVVGDGVHDSPVLDCSFLEIVTPEGWAFAARIWNQREATLLDRVIAGHDKVLPHVKSLEKTKQNRGKEYHDAVFAKEVYTRRFVHAPRHHRAIAALCHRYSAYSGTVRLVKRWLGAHWLLGGHVTEEAVEVLCALFFIGDGKYMGYDVDSEQAVNQPVPVTKERGFAVAVEFLKEWKWEEGMFVPLYGQQEGAYVAEGDESGEGGGAVGGASAPNVGSGAGDWQKQVKASSTSAWTISTEFDREGKMWTARGPDVVVAHRIKALANATWDYLRGIEQGNLNVQALFIHPTDDYDFVIQLNPAVLPRYAQNIAVNTNVLSKHEKYANNKLEDQDVVVRPGFDPVRLLFDDLQRIYADTFKIFYDPCGGDRFGAVWDPSVKHPRSFRVLGGFSSEPLPNENIKGKDKDLVSLNHNAILTEIERLGSGLISKIVVRT